jgi:hypothetical protein
VLPGSRMVQIRQILAESPLGCSQTCKKQQGNRGKRCPKMYWRTLQNVLDDIQNLCENFLSKTYTKLVKMSLIKQEKGASS